MFFFFFLSFPKVNPYSKWNKSMLVAVLLKNLPIIYHHYYSSCGLKEDISCSVATWGSKARMIFPTAPVHQTGWT